MSNGGGDKESFPVKLLQCSGSPPNFTPTPQGGSAPHSSIPTVSSTHL